MKLNTRSLFMKIFLWFWLVIALTGLVLFVFAIMVDSARNQDIHRQRAEERRLQIGQMLAFYGETAVRLMAREGPQSLDDYSERLARTAGIRPFFFLQPDQPHPGFHVPPEVMALAQKARQSGKAEYRQYRDTLAVAQPLSETSGKRAVVVGETRLDPNRPPRPPHPPYPPHPAPPEALAACYGKNPDDDCDCQTPQGMISGNCRPLPNGLACVEEGPPPAGPPLDPAAGFYDDNPTDYGSETIAGRLEQLTSHIDRYSRDLGRYFIILFIIGGIACYLLTWHLTAPLRRLRNLAQQLAGGDLTARVDPNLNRRWDEIAELGNDFNRMAEQIEKLIESQKRLLRDISHELRSPLARLNLALELARKSSGPEAQSSLARIERESGRLNDLIGQLLLLTKLECGEGRLHLEAIDLAALIAEIAQDVDFEAQSSGKRVEFLSNQPLQLMADQEMLRQAVENVVRNAVRYTPEGSTVSITLAQGTGLEKSKACVQVRDHGPGVPESALTQIFRPFFRVAEARERHSGGVGIGLAICERAVKLHGGSIRAVNAPDKGLIMEITLPIQSIRPPVSTRP